MIFSPIIGQILLVELIQQWGNNVSIQGRALGGFLKVCSMYPYPYDMALWSTLVGKALFLVSSTSTSHHSSSIGTTT